jgi:hypothetical protein
MTDHGRQTTDDGRQTTKRLRPSSVVCRPWSVIQNHLHDLRVGSELDTQFLSDSEQAFGQTIQTSLYVPAASRQLYIRDHGEGSRGAIR